MARVMGAWLSSIFRRSGTPRPDPQAPIRIALQRAIRGKYRVTIESPQGIVAATSVLKLLRNELIVAQPFMSGMMYPLADGELIKFSFIEQSTNLSAHARCIGRMKTPGPRGPVYLYRLTLPDTMVFEDRRVQPRNEIDPSVAPVVTVTGGRLREPLTGALADISATGLRVHTRTETECLEIGAELTVQFLLPEPAGVIDDVVELQRLERDVGTGLNAICVSFRRRLPKLEALLRMTTDRVPMPLERAQRRVA